MITLGLADGIRASASEIAIDALQAEAVGAGRLGLARTGLASVEIAAGIWARGLSGCEVEGDRYGVVSPDFLTDVARDLAWHGEHCSLIHVSESGQVELLRAHVEDVRGGPSRESWIYLLDVESPGGVSSGVTALAGEVLHVRYASRRNYPERGVSPLELAALSGGATAKVLSSIAGEAEIPSTAIVPMPQGQSQSAANALREALLSGKRTLFPETTASGAGGGMSNAPRTDWKPYRTQSEWPVSASSVYGLLLTELLSAHGIPAVFSPATSNPSGPGLREGLRQLYALTLRPLAVKIEAELARVLPDKVKLSFHDLQAADTAGRARALGILTKAGVKLEDALRLTGWS